jgi:hypothetical protein
MLFECWDKKDAGRMVRWRVAMRTVEQAVNSDILRFQRWEKAAYH